MIQLKIKGIPLTEDYCEKVKLKMPNLVFDKDTYFRVEISYHYDFFHKNGSHKKICLHQLNKPIIDALFEKLNLHSSNLWEIQEQKVHDKEIYTLISLRPL